MVYSWKPGRWLSILLAFAVWVIPYPARADVIYHAFNRPFNTLTTQLPTIKRYGYTHIQISPPQKSHTGDAWYFRYQPIDHTVIESPLGDEQALKTLIDVAHSSGLKVIVDAVLNHMADEGNLVETLSYPRFSSVNFHGRTCVDYGDRASVVRGWIGASCNLPDLSTEQAYVRQEAKNYLQWLFSLGTDGIRFDAGKHIEPQYFRELMTVLPQGSFVYAENIPENPYNSAEFSAYTDIGGFSLLDFFLTRTMQESFGPAGDLRSLADVNLVGKGRSLPGVVAVPFVRNHDTAKRTVVGYNFGDRQDVLLANAFILAREEGLPLIYGGDPQPPQEGEPTDSSLNDAEEAIVLAGVDFHERMLNKPQFFIPGNQIAEGADNPNTLFIRRGSDGLAIFNKAGAFFDVKAAKAPGMNTGCYRELHYNFNVSITEDGNGDRTISQWGTPTRGGISIGPRTALFLVQTSQDACKI